MLTLNSCVVCILVHGAFSVLSFGGPRGDDKKDWSTASVVLAEVAAYERLEKPGYVRITLDVTATLTGRYDAAIRPRVVATHISVPGLIVPFPPKPKARVLVLLQEREHGQYWIPTAHTRFLPAGRVMEGVESLNDPAVQKAIARLREVRAAMAKAEEAKPAAANAETAKK